MKSNCLIKNILGNDYLFSVVSKMFSIIVGIFHAAFLARFLGPELKGISASITSIVSVGCVLITCGIHQAFPYYRKKDHSKEFVNKFCSTIVIIYSALFVLACIASLSVQANTVVKASLMLIPIFGYETIINYVFLVEYPKKRNLTNSLSALIETFLLLVFWLLLEPNDLLMILSISVAIILRCIVSTVCLKFSFSFKVFSITYLGNLIRFGWIPMIALLLTILNSRLDIIILNGFSFISVYQVGIYSVGVGLAEKSLFIPDAIREILLGKLVSGKDVDEVSKACRLAFIISVAISFLILIFGKIAIRILFGEEYISSYPIAVICTFGTVFVVFIKMISQYNIVHKKQLTNIFLLLGAVILNLLLNLWLVPRYGVMGTAVASLVSHFVCGLSFALFFVKRTGIKLSRLIIINREDVNTIKNVIKSIKKTN